MAGQIEIPFTQLTLADLIVDAVYKGGNQGNVSDDPISKIMRCGNQGGFRFRGTVEAPSLCILYSDMVQPDWPDSLDVEAGQFTYYGDNRVTGSDLHRPSGNRILRNSFNWLHANNRRPVPPFYIFTKGPERRDVVFRGLAVPGAIGIPQTDDLVAIWKTIGTDRFQNYRSVFTILNIDVISRAWINDIASGNTYSSNAPHKWTDWIKSGQYSPLLAPSIRKYRTKQEQIPQNGLEKDIILCIINYFKNHSEREYAFEKCAAEIARMMDSNITSINLTRPWRDGGRDANGEYRIGTGDTHIEVQFSLEAKCHTLGNASGVKETSRLISRLRYRQFGIFVTTSHVDNQAYKEIIEDQHPVIVLCARDISRILIRSGKKSVQDVNNWLQSTFP